MVIKSTVCGGHERRMIAGIKLILLIGYQILTG